jgi:hypothetical protein
VLAAPKVKGVEAGAGVLVVFGAPLVLPNIPPVAFDVPNRPPEGAALAVPNIPPDDAVLDVPNRPPEGAALDVPNIPPEGAALEVPNMPPDGAELVVLFCASPPKGLLCGWALPNMDDAAPPNAGAAVLPFVAGAEVAVAKGLVPPAVKLKPVDDGGWGLKPVLWLFPPNAGKEEAEKLVLGAAGCAGGKLFVAPPPKALPPPNPPKLFAPVLPGAGADAPKLKSPCCGAPKFALCDKPCAHMLACACSLRRISRRPATVKRSIFMVGQ